MNIIQAFHKPEKTKKLFSVILKTIMASFLGFIILILLLQKDSMINLIIQDEIAELLSNGLQANVDCKIQSIDIISGNIYFNKFSCKSKDSIAFDCNCNNLTAHISWYNLFKNLFIDLSLHFSDVTLSCESKNNKIELLERLIKLIQAPVKLPIPVKFNFVSISKAAVKVFDKQKNSEFNFSASSNITIHNPGNTNIKIILSNGNFTVNNIVAASSISSNADLIINLSKKIFKATIDGTFDSKQLMQNFSFLGSHDHNLFNYKIISKDEKIKLNFDSEANFNLKIAPSENLNVKFNGNIINNIISGNCCLNELFIQFAIDLKNRIVSINNENQEVIKLSYKENHIHGHAENSFLNKIIKQLFKYKIKSKGITKLYSNINLENLDELNIKILSENLDIKLPNLYNVVKSIKTDIFVDLKKLNIQLRNAFVKLTTGTLVSQKINIWLSPDFNIKHVHVPFIFNDVLANFYKYLFTNLSGQLLFIYNNNTGPILSGQIFLTESNLAENILSESVQREVADMFFAKKSNNLKPINLNLDFETKQPLKIKSTFFKASAKLNINIMGVTTNPTIVGSIDLLSGELSFPYKPLYIQSGKIYLPNANIDDCEIEILATNKIKQYEVRMHIVGNIKNPKILLESTPNLLEEQIITLLLAGSHDGSLLLTMPTIAMSGLKNILFSSSLNKNKLQQYIKDMLNPLSGVNITPTFKPDYSGIKSSLQIDVNENLKAVVQPDINTPENSLLEIDYALSDDINIRGIKDESGNIGSEVEMRWRF